MGGELWGGVVMQSKICQLAFQVCGWTQEGLNIFTAPHLWLVWPPRSRWWLGAGSPAILPWAPLSSVFRKDIGAQAHNLKFAAICGLTWLQQHFGNDFKSLLCYPGRSERLIISHFPSNITQNSIFFTNDWWKKWFFTKWSTVTSCFQKLRSLFPSFAVKAFSKKYPFLSSLCLEVLWIFLRVAL